MSRFKKSVAAVAVAAAIGGGSPAVASAAPVAPAATSSSDDLLQAYAIVLSIGSAAFYSLPKDCLLYTSPSPRDGLLSRMPSSA